MFGPNLYVRLIAISGKVLFTSPGPSHIAALLFGERTMDKQSSIAVAKSDELPTITHRLRIGGHEITLNEVDEIVIDDNLVYLRPAANKILCSLIRANAGLCTLNELARLRVKGSDDPENSNSVKVHLSVIRTMLTGRGAALRRLITTVYSGGYHIDPRYYEEPALAPEVPVLVVGNKSVYFPVQGGCRINDDQIELGPIRTRLFRLLVERADTVLTWKDFATVTYGADQAQWPDQKLFDVLVCTLRARLRKSEALGRDVIETVWGRGYRILPDVHSHEQTQEPIPEPSRGYVIGPHGTVLTLRDLPDPKDRWVPRRKAILVALLEGALVTREYLLNRYQNLSDTELDDWITTYKRRGLRGLRLKSLVSAF